MAPADPADGISPPRFDPDSGQWSGCSAAPGPQREAGLARLHELLLRIARAELQRRSGQFRITGPELDDLAYQAAADALLAIVVKIGQFRGESRFTTWAYKFVILRCWPKSDAISGSTQLSRWTPRTGIGCPAGSSPIPRGRQSGGS